MWIWYFFMVFMSNKLHEWREKCVVLMGAFNRFKNQLQVELVRLKNIVFSNFSVYCIVLGLCVFVQNSISKSLIMPCLAFLFLNLMVLWFLYRMYSENSKLDALISFMILISYSFVLIQNFPLWLKSAVELDNIFGLLLFISMGIIYPYFWLYHVVARMSDEHPAWSFCRVLFWYEYVLFVQISVLCILGVFDECYWANNTFAIDSTKDIVRYICVALEKMDISKLSIHADEGIGVFGHYCVLLAGLALKNVPKYRKEMLQGAK
ncbi:hypothetical protein FYJ84_08680 [Veillonellaceae bacterium WCA-693-APC-5D-A]|uniref:Uncharacterized protein n=1 Tax=Anaerovibrio slackiae TaxID=2652309 RepID=A0A6I2UEC0_9FIRM|nr:hypothetical protein [Anaerovibrio slackiae]MSU09057.1 hypothetical protein [Anaerovibrio slackiae]